MASPEKLSNEQKEIIRSQNDALLRLPADLDTRLKLFADARLLRARENDQIAQVKKESGLRDHEKRLLEDYRIVPQTLKIAAILAKMPATTRAACCRQLIKVIEDEQYVYRDLFDEGAIGKEASDLEGGAVFDRTSEGGRRGGAKAQPRTVDEMAKSNVVHLPQHKPTEGIPLDVALRNFEEANARVAAYRKEHGIKPGAKKKELRDLEAAAEQARITHEAAAAAAAAGPADLPEAKPGEVSEAMRAGAAESEAHIREAVADKPKRASRKKADPAPEPAPQQAAADEDDDTIDVEGEADGPAAPPAPPAQRPDAIGTAASTYRAG